MNTALIVFLLAGQSAGSGAPVRPVERIIRIDVPGHDGVYALQHEIKLAIIDAQDNYVTAYADDEKIERLRQLGYPVTILVEDYQKQAERDLVTYYTYPQVCSIMYAVATQYPAITRLETLGISVGGRAILIMKVTSNPGQEANKPRIRLNGPHHGNEKIATEITLAFLQYLCSNYATNQFVRDMVDTREIWIDPIFNVDGHVSNSRGNGNGEDLNRDYGYEWDPIETPGPFSQIETKAMRNHSEKHVIVLEFSYHSTAAYVNYLWDNHPSDPPDSGWILALSEGYADSTYGSGTQLEPINGYDWYEVHGSCQDCTFGVYGGLAWTIETALPSTRPAIDNICVANRRALLEMVRLAGWGVQGLVYDSVTGTPLFARIEFTAPYRWTTYTQPQVGDFHRMLAAGTYTVKASANGYIPKTISSVVVPDTGAVSLDFPLVRPVAETPNYVQKVVWVRRIDDSHTYRDWTIRALGEPDGASYTVGPSPSTIVFDVDPFQPVRNRQGNDITVYAFGSYALSAASNWEGPWSSLGNGNGQTSFDLASVGLDSARYLRIVSSGTVTLDAISYLGSPLTDICEPRAEQILGQFTVSPNPVSTQAVISFQSALNTRADIRIADVTGRTVRSLARQCPGEGELAHLAHLAGSRQIVWDLRDDAGRAIADGVYFCRLEARAGSIQKKLVVQR
jgi:hypothetical protein